MTNRTSDRAAAMVIIESPTEMQAFADAARARGQRIAFVPTMGYLHDGHLSLLVEGRRRADVLVISSFVNPTQFAPHEDLARYPRDRAGDLAKAARLGTDVFFAPDSATMYPPGAQTAVEVGEVSQGLCGDRRPGHFRGVATVVSKLFNLVKPHLALFGEKDFQQLLVIRRMTADLNFPIEIIGLPTLREADGLAMSSRNSYLSAADRARAAGIFRGLEAARSAAAAGQTDADALLRAARPEIERAVDRLDYLELRDAETLRPLDRLDREGVLLVAAFVGTTRLIDNRRIPVPAPAAAAR